MVRVTAAKPNLMTDPANPNRATLRTDPNGGGGVVFGFTGLELGLVSVARRPVAVWLIRDDGYHCDVTCRVVYRLSLSRR